MSVFDKQRFLNKTGEWLKGSGPDNDIVISSRIRLARNIDNILFPGRLTKKNAKDVIDYVVQATAKSDFLKKNM